MAISEERRQQIQEVLRELEMATAAKTKKNTAMVDMKRASAAVLIYKPGIEDDIQAAAFLGAALLQDKKIILVAQNATEIPEKVYFLADKVIRSDDPLALVSRIEDYTSEWGVTEDAPIVVNP